MLTVSWRETGLRFQTISGGTAFSKSWVSNCCWESMCRQQMTAARLLQAISFNCGKKSSSCLSMKMLSRCFSAQWFWFFRIFDLHPCKRTLRIPKKRFRACRRFAVFCRLRIGLCKVAPRGLPYSVLHLGNTCAAHQMFSHTVTQLTSTKISLVMMVIAKQLIAIAWNWYLFDTTNCYFSSLKSMNICSTCLYKVIF